MAQLHLTTCTFGLPNSAGSLVRWFAGIVFVFVFVFVFFRLRFRFQFRFCYRFRFDRSSDDSQTRVTHVTYVV